MKRLYDKSPLAFALLSIALYIVGSSAADAVGSSLTLGKGITLLFHLALSIALFFFLKSSGLLTYYGLFTPHAPLARTLYYLPLALLCSVNAWFGLTLRMPWPDTLLYVGSMVCVGFLEELIFRGLLFRAMEKNGLYSAITVSSLTFGIGHILNLVNGSGADLLATLCQIASATAFGFLFVVLFWRGGSLVPCIVAHSAINGLSAFSNEAVMGDPTVTVLVSLALCLGAAAYTVVLLFTLPPVRHNYDKATKKEK